ncbi:MAG: LptF/LptG family permease [Bacteroidetes bacterium]|nr:LptF/LptG family permease [Bacteroidota bacterium]
MKKIDYYIIKKFLGTFFFSIALLIVIVVVFDFSEKIDDFILKEAPLKEIIFSYYLNFIPYFVNLFVYLFTFISVIFFTSKMAANTEIVAIVSSGISYNRLMRPYLISSIFLAVMSFLLANFVIPQTNKTLLAFEEKYVSAPRSTRDINIHLQVAPETYIYVESYNALTATGHKFSLEKINKKGLYYKLTSEKAVWDSLTSNWSVYNYAERTIDGLKETISKGKLKKVAMDLKPEDFTFKVEDVITMNFADLNRFIKDEKMKGTKKVVEYIVAKQKRIANPFATIILTFIGFSLSSRKVRGGIGMNLGIGITITFTYILFMQVSSVYATYGNLPPFWAAWLPNVFFGALAVVLVRIAPK